MLKSWQKQVAYKVLSEPGFAWLKMRYFAHQHRLGRGEEPEMRFLPFFVRQGDTVLDLGANVGFYTVRLSHLVGPTGMVHALEPVPETLAILRYVTKTLGLKNVSLHAVAVSDRVGTAEVYVPLDSSGIPNYYLSHLQANGHQVGRRVTTSSRTLDDLRPSFRSNVSCIKCDVEGAELPVLKGGRNLFASDRPVLLCEVSEYSSYSSRNGEEVFDLLHEWGFRGYRIEGDSLLGCDRWTRGTINYFFIPAEQPAPFLGLEGL